MPEPKVWLQTFGMLILIGGTTDDVLTRLEISGTRQRSIRDVIQELSMASGSRGT
jgi:hypothetical protein